MAAGGSDPAAGPTEPDRGDGSGDERRREAPRRGDDGARTHQRCLGNHRKERPSPPPSIPSTHVQSLVEGEASCRDGVFEGVP